MQMSSAARVGAHDERAAKTAALCYTSYKESITMIRYYHRTPTQPILESLEAYHTGCWTYA